MSVQNVPAWIHLDLKGAPPKIEYFVRLLHLLREWEVRGVLIEYEDAFPYSGSLNITPADDCYSTQEISQILQTAKDLNLEVIPLIQSMGHMEFVLKNETRKSLRELEEFPECLCPVIEESFELVVAIVDEILAAHPQVGAIHIGGDEVWHLAQGPKTREFLELNKLSKEDVFLRHMKRLASHIKQVRPGIRVLMWDDMLRAVPEPILVNHDIGSLVEPVVWNYHRQVPFPDEMWKRYKIHFPSLWIASAFKGATSSCAQVPDIAHHLDNHISWQTVVEKQGLSPRGLILTGWQRFDHFASLCELLPVGLPSLLCCLTAFRGQDIAGCRDKLGLDFLPFSVFPRPETLPQRANFPGDRLYLVMEQFVTLQTRVQELQTSGALTTWFSEYQISRGRISKLQIRHLSFKFNEYLNQAKQFETLVPEILSSYFKECTVREWMGCYVKPLINQLSSYKHRADQCFSH